MIMPWSDDGAPTIADGEAVQAAIDAARAEAKDVVAVLRHAVRWAYRARVNWGSRDSAESSQKNEEAAIAAVAELIAAAQDIRTNGLGTASGKRLDDALAACKLENANG